MHYRVFAQQANDRGTVASCSGYTVLWSERVRSGSLHTEPEARAAPTGASGTEFLGVGVSLVGLRSSGDASMTLVISRVSSLYV